jgi:hypothetical protein
MEPTRELLLRIVDEGYTRSAWHGPNLRAVLRGLTLDEALWRPALERHNAWELMLHCAYWKFIAWRRLTGARSVAFAREGRNFFAPPVPSAAAWRSDLRLLEESHAALRSAVAELPPSVLASRSRTIYGVAMHDVYHAGQIRLLVRLHS